MTTRSTILLALTLAFVGIFMSSCNKERIETIDIPKPFAPPLGVDSIYWDKHLAGGFAVPQISNATKLGDELRVTTPRGVQIVVENVSVSTVREINLWAHIQGVNEDIRIAYLDKIPPASTQIFTPSFVYRSVYLPCASKNVIQLFLPSIIQNSNITITYVLSNQ